MEPPRRENRRGADQDRLTRKREQPARAARRPRRSRRTASDPIFTPAVRAGRGAAASAGPAKPSAPQKREAPGRRAARRLRAQARLTRFAVRRPAAAS